MVKYLGTLIPWGYNMSELYFISFVCLWIPTFSCLSSCSSALNSSVLYLLLSFLGALHHTLVATVLTCFSVWTLLSLLTTDYLAFHSSVLSS